MLSVWEMLNSSLSKSLLGHSACSAQPPRLRLSLSAVLILAFWFQALRLSERSAVGFYDIYTLNGGYLSKRLIT